MNFIFSLVAVVWIIEHIWLVLGIIAALIVLIIVWAVIQKKHRRAYLALPVLLIGNKSTKIYHDPYCRKLSNAKASNLVGFRMEREVTRSGYSPCAICRPRWPHE